MLTPQQVIKRMDEMQITQASVCIGADLAESEFSNWLRGRRELAPGVLERIDVALAAIENICFDGHEWPLNWRSARMVEIIRKYVRAQEEYRADVKGRALAASLD